MLASKTLGFDFGLLILTVLGVSLIIGSACVINNIIDQDIDKFMERTKKRALVLKTISPNQALVFAVILGIAGFGILSVYTNTITVLIGLVGYFDYIVLYGWGKRNTVHGTLIGTVAGATPIAAGYTAVTGSFDSAAALLFLAMVFWQMPHFYAIAIRRQKEYKAAKIPVLPVKKGVARTKVEMLIYIAAFGITALLLSIFGYAGLFYTVVMLIVSLYWLFLGTKGYYTGKDTDWAKRMFLFSLVVLVAFSLTLIIDSLLSGGIV